METQVIVAVIGATAAVTAPVVTLITRHYMNSEPKYKRRFKRALQTLEFYQAYEQFLLEELRVCEWDMGKKLARKYIRVKYGLSPHPSCSPSQVRKYKQEIIDTRPHIN
ncbi:hypothetical protein [Idiomarina abyssalis]|uniref:Uncharacterized protein n=1 Tax=Idiomarina abyssalis TaxID=86102 RepID=A0A8I1KI93_9GAMM|nr:hypothetical protein [Idiomarina abyssalis]MBJ7265539.1 hypothetical protein [Idiomarina abyssalis]MBJ7316787.1 hypothetical protein [Idiomarina abyssalis]